MALVKREINLAFSLGKGSFGEDGSDVVEITGLRTSCTITRAGGQSMSTLNLQVWGMPMDVMQKLTVLNVLLYEDYRRNYVTVTAGDSERGYGVVFSGDINQAWIDANGETDVCFVLTAFEGLGDKVRPVAPNSFKGPASVDTLMASIAKQMKPPRAFENNGVTTILENGYYPGTLVDQMNAIAAAAQCTHYLDNTTLAIWPKGQARGDAVLDVSPETGLVGYPQFSQVGVNLQMLFSPTISYGQRIKLRSTLGPPATGNWVVWNVTHSLESEVPGGRWFTQAECSRDGAPLPVGGEAL